MLNLILALVATSLFIVYNAVAIGIFKKVPSSLSVTFYYYQDLKEGLGYVFTGFMFIMGMCLLPAWIEITETISDWSHYLTVLPFLGAGSIVFVGSAPAFRGVKLENTVHMASAGCAAAFSLIWCFVVCWKYMYIPAAGILLAAILGAATKTWKTARDYWLEMMAFYATFLTIIFVSCNQIWNWV